MVIFVFSLNYIITTSNSTYILLLTFVYTLYVQVLSDFAIGSDGSTILFFVCVQENKVATCRKMHNIMMSPNYFGNNSLLAYTRRYDYGKINPPMTKEHMGNNITLDYTRGICVHILSDTFLLLLLNRSTHWYIEGRFQQYSGISIVLGSSNDRHSNRKWYTSPNLWHTLKIWYCLGIGGPSHLSVSIGEEWLLIIKRLRSILWDLTHTTSRLCLKAKLGAIHLVKRCTLW